MITPAPPVRYGLVGEATSPPGGQVGGEGTSPPAGQVRWDLFDFNRALDSSGLPPLVQLVLAKLMFAPDRGGDGLADRRDISVNALARRCGTKSRDTIERSLKTAEREGWLEFVRRGRGRRTAYRLVMPVRVDNSEDLPGERVSASPDLPDERVGTYPVSGKGLPDERVGIYPLLTEIPSIDQSVRARVRQACPDLTPDDDDLARLIANLETRTPIPVRNVVGYLQRCAPADIRRLLAETKRQVNAQTSTNATRDEAPVGECEHGHDAGTNPATNTARCPVARRAGVSTCPPIPHSATRVSRSVPFVASLDGQDRTATPDAAEALSEPVAVGAGA